MTLNRRGFLQSVAAGGGAAAAAATVAGLPSPAAAALERDPKQTWADRHPEFFPVRLRSAPQEAILRVPGLGPQTVNRILATRRHSGLRSLRQVGMRGKRDQKNGHRHEQYFFHFITD
jgi:hypothetical protein